MNRRSSLLVEAERLATALGPKAPAAQLAILGVEYSEIGDFENAIKYLSVMTTSPSKSAQLGGWRSIALNYFYQGRAGIDKGREAFAKALAVYPEPKDDGEANMELAVQEQWAQNELAFRNFDLAREHFSKALDLARRLTCTDLRARAFRGLNEEARAAFGASDFQGTRWTVIPDDECH